MPLRFFHGTHSGNLTSIRQNGLTPLPNPVSAMRGNQSTIPGFTEHRIFLAPSINEAAYYASEQAGLAKTKPVILVVTLPDDANLTVSDDYIHTQAINAMLSVAGLPPLELDEEGDIHEYGKSSPAYYAWREIFAKEHQALLNAAPFESLSWQDEYAEELAEIGHVDLAPAIWQAASLAAADAVHHPWRESIATRRDPAVAYQGIIPPSCLALLNPQAVAHAIKHIARGDFSPAEWDIEVPAPEEAEVAADSPTT